MRRRLITSPCPYFYPSPFLPLPIAALAICIVDYLHSPISMFSSNQRIERAMAIYRRLSLPFITIQPNFYLFCLSLPNRRARFSSSTADPACDEFHGENAYELLGISESSSFDEIKSAFRKMAKETHPDVAESKNDSTNAHQFVQILAAYEILSDSEKRIQYDMYLLSKRRIMQKYHRQGSTLYMYKSDFPIQDMEVVEWLKWYRMTIKDILSERKVVVGTGYFDELEDNFYSAIHAAYYGPEIKSMDLLPDRFEAEERSVYDTPEVLHLVSGRNLFGMVCVVNKIPELSLINKEKLTSFSCGCSGIFPFVENARIHMNSDVVDEIGVNHSGEAKMHMSDAYKDLELHVCGRTVAVATRIPPKRCCEGEHGEDTQDRIHVFLNSQDPSHNMRRGHKDSILSTAVRSRIPIGSISGLGTSPEEGSCYIYNTGGIKTHVLMKHRTLLVKHMHWYRVEDKVSICECRCTRARLPPSKFWLFEPRCGVHDIGGWYVETYGRDKQEHTTLSQRYWEGFDDREQYDKRLHPAVYLLALAYRSLDLEDARRRKRTVRNILECQLVRIISWCKKLM